MRTATTIFLLSAAIIVADDREPIGSTTSWVAKTNDNRVTFHFHNYSSGSNWVVNAGPLPINLPHTFKDPDSGIVYYVESDGRHVTAINPEGKILWSRDPFADAKLDFYRTKTPRIVSIGRLENDKSHNWIRKVMASKGTTNFICITFNSTQFGCLDVENGHFILLGQD
jgi:hypothetical protein